MKVKNVLLLIILVFSSNVYASDQWRIFGPGNPEVIKSQYDPPPYCRWHKQSISYTIVSAPSGLSGPIHDSFDTWEANGHLSFSSGGSDITIETDDGDHNWFGQTWPTCNITWQVYASTSNTYYVDSSYIISSGANADDQFFYKATAVDVDGLESAFSNTDQVYGEYNNPWKINTADSMLVILPETLPESYSLGPNFPNPFNPTTAIRYDLPEDSYVELKVYDLIGREIRTLIHENQVAGSKNVQWDGKESFGNPVSSGMYVYHISARSRESNLQFSQTRKMILLK